MLAGASFFFVLCCVEARSMLAIFPQSDTSHMKGDESSSVHIANCMVTFGSDTCYGKAPTERNRTSIITKFQPQEADYSTRKLQQHQKKMQHLSNLALFGLAALQPASALQRLVLSANPCKPTMNMTCSTSAGVSSTSGLEVL